MTHRIVPIVEGHGEVEALNILLRRMLGRIDRDDLSGSIHKPQKADRYKIVKEGELEKEIDLALRSTPSCEAIIIVLDADKDCPEELGWELLGRAIWHRPEKHFEVCIAKKMFESWLIGGIRGIDSSLTPPSDPEVKGKGWIKKHVEKFYMPRIHQSGLTDQFDIDESLRSCQSLRHLDKCVKRLAIQLPKL